MIDITLLLDTYGFHGVYKTNKHNWRAPHSFGVFWGHFVFTQNNWNATENIKHLTMILDDE